MSPTLTAMLAEPRESLPTPRKAPDQVRPLELDDLTATSDLLADGFGRGFIDELTLSAYATQMFSQDQFGFVAGSSDGVVLVDVPGTLPGFRSRLPGKHAADRVLHLFPDVDPAASRVGLISTLAVSRNARRRGVGTRLMRQAVHLLWEAGIEQVVAVGALHGDDCPAETPLLDAGFIEVAVLPHLWLEDSLARCYTCPFCPHGHCRCAAVVFAAATRPAAMPVAA